MKKTVSIIMSVLLVVTMMTALAGCGSDTDRIVGKWEAALDLGAMLNESLKSDSDMPLRYNYDKPEKPRRIKGFEVFSLVFSSFSKPKNHTEISRIIGGVSLTTNE